MVDEEHYLQYDENWVDIVLPEKTPWEAKANTLLAPNSFNTSAALHRVPAVSTMSSTTHDEREREKHTHRKIGRGKYLVIMIEGE